MISLRILHRRGLLAVALLAALPGGVIMPVALAAAAVSPFMDTAGHLFAADIEWLRQAEITGGCGGGRFCPDALVTRGQMASFLVRAFHLTSSAPNAFTDDDGSMHQPDVNSLAAAGVTGGCGAGRFCPDAVVTRGQMASFLARARGLPAATHDYFSDDSGSVHQSDINRLAEPGITGGCGVHRFCPEAAITRGQMAAFLHRALTTGVAPPLPLAPSALPPPTGTGLTYYLSPTGSDGGAGTLESPWRTIAHASQRLRPGDTLYAHGGTYTGQGGYNWATSASGTASAGILLAAYPGEAPVFDGGWTIGEGLILKDVGWIVVDGLTFTHFDNRWGNGAIYLMGATHHVTIQNSRFIDNGADSLLDHHIYITSGPVHDVLIRSNQFIGAAHGGGIHTYHDPGPRNVEITGNYFRGNHWGIIFASASSGIAIHHNTFEANTTNMVIRGTVSDYAVWGNSPDDVHSR